MDNNSNNLETIENIQELRIVDARDENQHQPADSRKTVVKTSSSSLPSLRDLIGVRVPNEWRWDKMAKSECVSLSEDGKTAYFFDNPYTISRGTAGVRGSKPVGEGIFYFEVKTNETLYGTAVMIGFGSGLTRLHYDNFEYVNLIGMDTLSWGMCHKGNLWHAGRHRPYCEPIFERDNRIGALINTYDQTIRFFLNDQDLGLAFSNVNVPGKYLFPIISSTATDIELELVESFKIVSSLQDLCFRRISQVLKENGQTRSDRYGSLPIAQRLIQHLKKYY